jgi:hypothetical protein
VVRSTKIIELPGRCTTNMMAAHGSATKVFETVVPSTPACDTEISRAKRRRPLGGGLENLHRQASAADRAQTRAEAQSLNTHLQGSATAIEQVFQQRFQLLCTPDAIFHFQNFAVGKFFPSRSDGRVVSQAIQKNLGLGQCEPHFARETNEKNAVECITGITPLAANTVRRRKQAHVFVVTDRGRIETAPVCEFANLHILAFRVILESALDLKSTLTFSICEL